MGRPAASPHPPGLVPFLFRYVRRHLAWGLVALAAVVVFALTSGATVFLIDPVFQEVLMTSREGGALPGLALPAGGGELPEKARRLDLRRRLDAGYERLKEACGASGDDVVWFVPLLILAVFWIRSVADFVSGYAFQRVGLGVTTAIRNDIARHVAYQSSRFHEAHATGELASRVVGDVTILQVAVSTRVLDLFQQSITLVVLVGMLLSTNFKLALASLAVAPFVVYPIVRFGRGMRKTSQDSQEQMAEIGKLLVEIARGYKVVRAFGKQEYEIARFARATRRHLGARLRAEVFANVSGPVVGAVGALGAAAFLVYAGHAIRSGALTGVAVIQFLANLVLMYDPIRRLNKVHLLVQDAAAAVRRVADLLAIPLDVAERPGAKRLTGFRSGIAFEGVEYAYGDKPALRGVSFEVRRGEIVALVGPSGAGKSTVVSLLLRFDDPAAGRITIDGRDLRDLTLDSLSGLMSIVTQETVLFDDTVRANIAYGRPDLSLDRVREAAAAAYADEFVSRMPQGYDTHIGEGGFRLSGGERQRIAIARALLADPPVLILDEATSQIDSESEATIQKALDALMRDRTTLVIAHRLATVMGADRILVLDGGRVVETGTHAELLAAGGLYRRLHDLQFQL